MTECNGCGGCCNPVALPYSQAKANFLNLHPDDQRWTQQDLTEIALIDTPVEIRHWLKKVNRLSIFDNDEKVHLYRCRHFDPESRRCTNYADRPPACRNYPWGWAGVPNPLLQLPPACSFNADIGQPIELISKPSG